MKVEQEFYSVQEIAVILNMKTSTIYKRIHNGDLKSIRIGRTIRISRNQIELLKTSSMIH